MINRVKQVLAAVTAKISAADQSFINSKLTAKEQQLFYGMNLPDQRHALNVAQTILQLAPEASADQQEFLVVCALLHDVGKMKGDVSTLDKIITVLAHSLAPRWAKTWGRLSRGGRVANLRHAFYIYFHHAERGAKLLEQIGQDALVVKIIRRHHDHQVAGEPEALTLLRQADNLN
jgi:putative nucleotidyltransferase with HDIG domain